MKALFQKITVWTVALVLALQMASPALAFAAEGVQIQSIEQNASGSDPGVSQKSDDDGKGDDSGSSQIPAAGEGSLSGGAVVTEGSHGTGGEGDLDSSAGEKGATLEQDDATAVDTDQLEGEDGATADGEPEEPDKEMTESEKLAAEHASDLPDGTYIIASSLSVSQVLDARNGGTANNTAVQIYSENGTNAQYWRVSHVDDYVVLTNVGSGKALDVPFGCATSNAQLQLYEHNGTLAQKWIAIKLDDGSYVFRSAVDPAMAIDLPGAATGNSTRVQLYGSNGTGAQKWILSDPARSMDYLDELADQYRDAVPDGEYAIVSGSLTAHMVLDVASGSTADSANVWLYQWNATNAQRWIVSHDDEGYITLTSVGSGKVLDVSGANKSVEANVCQYQANGSDAQKWVAVPNGDGTFTLHSAVWKNRVLDIAGGSTKNGANAQTYFPNGSSAQSFTFYSTDVKVPAGERFTEIEGQWFTMEPSHASGMALDVASGSWSNGALLQLYSSNSTMAQLFSFEYRDGYYLIRNAASGKVLDVQDSMILPGATIQQWASGANNAAQLFSVSKNDDGTYTFVNKATGLALDVSGAGVNDGTKIDGYTPNGTAAQKFNLLEQDQLIKPGVYMVASAANTSNVFDITSGSISNNANVQVYASNNSLAQRWLITPVEGKENTYTLTSLQSAKLLTMTSDGNVVQSDTASDASQEWVAFVDADGVKFANAADQKVVLDVEGGSTESGANVQAYQDNGTIAQRFKLKAADAVIPNGAYTINVASKNSMVADVASGSMFDGANVRLYGSNDTGAQKWNFTRNGDGSYTIVNAASGKALDVQNGMKVSGANVQQYASNNSAAQKWFISFDENGFKIASALDQSLVLDVSGGNLANGANIQIYSSNDSVAQRFVLKKTTYVPPLKQEMTSKAQGYSSNTKWLLMVDTKNCKVGVFSGSRNNWNLKYFWDCGPGKASTPTVLGQFTVQAKGYSFGHGYTCYYYTQFYGDYLFHSIKYYQGTRVVMDGRLGMGVSNGCVRLDINNAKWIYDNIPRGTKVVVYR